MFEVLRKLGVLAYYRSDEFDMDSGTDDGIADDNWDWLQRWVMMDCDPDAQFGRGCNHWNAQLTEDDVMWMREADQRGMSLKEIGGRTTSASNVYAIVTGRTWTHIPVLRGAPWITDPEAYMAAVLWDIEDQDNPYPSKLSAVKVLEIRAAQGFTQKRLARLHHVSVKTISDILNRHTWAHVA